MDRKLLIRIDTAGTITLVHDDRMDGLHRHGCTTITRASHVEPNSDLKWHVDLSPVGGPLLTGFPTRETALSAEADWLNLHVLAGAKP